MKFYFKHDTAIVYVHNAELIETRLHGTCNFLDLHEEDWELYVSEGTRVSQISYTVIRSDTSTGKFELNLERTGLLDRRLAYRLKYDLPCAILTKDTCIEVGLVDVSLTGLRFLSDKPINEKRLHLRLELEDGPIIFTGENLGGIAQDDQYIHRVQFLRVPYKDESRLAKVLNALQINMCQ